MKKARYQIMLRKNKSGKSGSTQYAYSTKLKAVVFAAGYQTALRDIGRSDLYVSVWDNGLYTQPNPDRSIVMDTDQLQEIATREY